MELIDFEEKITTLLQEKNFAQIRELLSEINPIDLAIYLSNLPPEILPKVFRLLPKDTASEVFIELDSDAQRNLISLFTDAELSDIINDLFADDTVELIEEMPANVVTRIIKSVSPQMRETINHLLNYPKDSAGAIMTTEYITLKADFTVEQSFEKIRRQGLDKKTIYTCYVTDNSRKLIGVISARTLMLSQPSQKVGDIMEKNVIFASTSTDKEEVALQINKYGFLALPIVDNEHRIVGIVTIDDAMDILQKESTEDINKMAAIVPTNLPYLKTSTLKIVLSRLPWLLILMISATITGWIIRKYESALDLPVIGIILTACIPMLMDTGGNAGSQASITIIRALALGEISTRDVFRILLKEFRVSIFTGLTLAITCFAKLMLIDMLYKQNNGALIAFVICLSMFLTVIIAKLIGSILPIIAKKLKQDPAVFASPFITTIVDALSLLIYCNIAIALLS